MEFAIIMICVFAAPMLESLIMALIGVIEAKWKWHPLKKKFNETIADVSDRTFVMMKDAGSKTVQILALVFASLGLAFAIAMPIFLYVTEQATTVDIIITTLLFHAVIQPLFLWALHSTTTKIYFSESYILKKSAIYLKKIHFNQIIAAGEIYNPQPTRKLIIKYNCGNRQKTFEINNNFSNYELAKTRLTDILKR